MQSTSDALRQVGPLADLLTVRLRNVDILLSDIFYRQYEADAPSEWLGALAVIDSNPGVTQREVATLVRRHPSAIVTVVNSLEHRGWVVRNPSVNDKRKYALHATPAGRAELHRITAEMKKAEHNLLAGVSPEELAFLHYLLEKVRASCINANELKPG
jgi:DNA-binding MarR family transcriptional regulator